MMFEAAEEVRKRANAAISATNRKRFAQFTTPAAVGALIAGTFEARCKNIRLLDPGAGAGSLTAAFVAQLCSRAKKPQSLEVVALEIDSLLIPYLNETLKRCSDLCAEVGIRFSTTVHECDFLSVCEAERTDLWKLVPPLGQFDCAILNPPYKKIASTSRARSALRALGIETSNLYSGFLALALRLLKNGGELASITPRSFCNGTYFRPFRREFLANVALDAIHIFESRKHAFSEDDVLQESVILHAFKGVPPIPTVSISTSTGKLGDIPRERRVPYRHVVSPSDPELFIHIPTKDDDEEIKALLSRFQCSLEELGITVSTGRVVDFRAKDALLKEPTGDCVPLIYPAHFADGFIRWPRAGFKKANAILRTKATEGLLLPSGTYVLVKRFSAKEEARRIVAAVFRPEDFAYPCIGFENHLNYFHHGGEGLERNLALGLAAFLNSGLIDRFFRRFNGHTQVNATDLRSLRYPSSAALMRLGERVLCGAFPTSNEIDAQLRAMLAE